MNNLKNDMAHLTSSSTSLTPETLTEHLKKRPTCEICRSTYTIDTAPTWEQLCPEHQTAVNRRLEERLLQNVIPKTFHKAQTSDIPKPLQQWTGADGVGLYIHGAVGTGKTHLAAALTKHWYQHRLKTCNTNPNTNLTRYPQIIWHNLPNLIQQTQATFNKNTSASNPEQAWLTAQTAELLIIDDIGIETPQPWITQKLYTLTEHRLHHQLPTIYTSNKTLPQLTQHHNSPQTTSRIKQTTQTIQTHNTHDKRTTQNTHNTTKHPQTTP